eukprot:5874623-Amphidinium_carterae.1
MQPCMSDCRPLWCSTTAAKHPSTTEAKSVLNSGRRAHDLQCVSSGNAFRMCHDSALESNKACIGTY